MARNSKLFADGEQIYPETVTTQVKNTDNQNVDEIISTLNDRIEALENRTSEIVYLESIAGEDNFNGDPFTWDVVMHNWDTKYADFDNYRLVYMSKRCWNGGRGYEYRWRVPMFYEMFPHPNDETNPVADISRTAVTPAPVFRVITGTQYQFPQLDKMLSVTDTRVGTLLMAGSFRKTSYVGVALFKRTGTGQYGWQRISNIAGLRYSIGRVKTGDPTQIKPNREAFHEV